MKKIKFALTFLVFALAITGVVVAKTNEKKRFTQINAYFLESNGTTWHEIQSNVSQIFDTKGTATQAALRDQNNNLRLLYLTQANTSPAKFIYP